MQTFLPSPIFTDSASMLDRQRLGKQRVETLQIMTALIKVKGWVNHPVTKMWAGYEWALLDYQKAICKEWTDRGYKDSCLWKTFDLFSGLPSRNPNLIPPWLGDKDFHLAHQSNLIRKDPLHYGPLFPGVPNDLPYIYPVKD